MFNPLTILQNPAIKQAMDLANQLKSTPNPILALQQMGQNDPLVARALEMASNGNPEEIVKNLCKERGIDFEQAKQMANSMGLKL